MNHGQNGTSGGMLRIRSGHGKREWLLALLLLLLPSRNGESHEHLPAPRSACWIPNRASLDRSAPALTLRTAPTQPKPEGT